jgi:hypothetical protein
VRGFTWTNSAARRATRHLSRKTSHAAGKQIEVVVQPGQRATGRVAGHGPVLHFHADCSPRRESEAALNSVMGTTGSSTASPITLFALWLPGGAPHELGTRMIRHRVPHVRLRLQRRAIDTLSNALRAPQSTDEPPSAEPVR